MATARSTSRLCVQPFEPRGKDQRLANLDHEAPVSYGILTVKALIPPDWRVRKGDGGDAGVARSLDFLDGGTDFAQVFLRESYENAHVTRQSV